MEFGEFYRSVPPGFDPSYAPYTKGYSRYTRTVCDFKKRQYEDKAQKIWDIFYKTNENRFFKDRHYLHREFSELLNPNCVLLEAGCGVGNAFYPLLEVNPSLKVYGFDFSNNAVSIIKSHPSYDPSRISVFVWDLASPKPIPIDLIPNQVCDCATLIFVLSAMSFEKMHNAIQLITPKIKIGGKLFIRDYAEGDMAHERFSKRSKLDERFYVRGDGTRVFYFTCNELAELVCSNGDYEVEQNDITAKHVVNVAEEKHMDRRFVQLIAKRISKT